MRKTKLIFSAQYMQIVLLTNTGMRCYDRHIELVLSRKSGWVLPRFAIAFNLFEKHFSETVFCLLLGCYSMELKCKLRNYK